ncbi:DUF3157 family protein [Shewanella cyperi]|uniref:DUF3157 family protein n=1 Tax=Shewanella cyperi TaxID=2814292 RepID=A0A974XLP4_9GAMM|nr:DUF3157 family protein [Shewanella cyperi]QSX29336.1 DUF3157 family protein [Shewanella cyperi]
MTTLKGRLLLPLTAALLCLPLTALAASKVAEVTLDNGARVILKDDFSWEYLIIETPDASVQAAEAGDTELVPEASAPSAAAAPAAPVAKAAPVQLNSTAMTMPELLGKAGKDGISVSFAEAQWQGDRLGLVFDISSEHNEELVEVMVQASFFDDQGQKIKQEELQVWRAIKRIPDTYLRKGQHRRSDIIWVEGLDKSRWQKQLLQLKITELSTW